MFTKTGDKYTSFVFQQIIFIYWSNAWADYHVAVGNILKPLVNTQYLYKQQQSKFYIQVPLIVFTLFFPCLRKIVIKIGKKKKRKPPSSEEESDDDPPPRHSSKDDDSVRFITCPYTNKGKKHTNILCNGNDFGFISQINRVNTWTFSRNRTMFCCFLDTSLHSDVVLALLSVVTSFY